MTAMVQYDDALLREIEQFIYREARLQDEHEYDDWEALWTDDAIYYIPANGEGGDPENEMSMVYDNRSRIALRVKQFHTGKRHTQIPRSRLRRLVSNIELVKMEGEDIHVKTNAFIYESNHRGEVFWPTANEYRLRRTNGELKMSYKKVVVINNDKPLYTMSFLI